MAVSGGGIVPYIPKRPADATPPVVPETPVRRGRCCHVHTACRHFPATLFRCTRPIMPGADIGGSCSSRRGVEPCAPGPLPPPAAQVLAGARHGAVPSDSGVFPRHCFVQHCRCSVCVVGVWFVSGGARRQARQPLCFLAAARDSRDGTPPPAAHPAHFGVCPWCVQHPSVRW